MVRSKIINPKTGRWVLAHGKLGTWLIKQGLAIDDWETYANIKCLWDWWCVVHEEDRQYIIDAGYWDPKLSDPIKGLYPFCLTDYQNVLEKARSILWNKTCVEQGWGVPVNINNNIYI